MWAILDRLAKVNPMVIIYFFFAMLALAVVLFLTGYHEGSGMVLSSTIIVLSIIGIVVRIYTKRR